MKKLIYILISFLFVNTLLGQQIENAIPACDTLTGEMILIEQSKLVDDCCHKWNGVNWEKLPNCDNVVPGACPDQIDKQCWGVIDSNLLCTYNTLGFSFAGNISQTGVPYVAFVQQIHVDEFFVNGMLIPINYPYITSTSNYPPMLNDVVNWMNANGYVASLSPDGAISVNQEDMVFTFCGDSYIHELDGLGGFTGNTTLSSEDNCYTYFSENDCGTGVECTWYELWFDKRTNAFVCAYDDVNNKITDFAKLPAGIQKLPCPVSIKFPEDDNQVYDNDAEILCAYFADVTTDNRPTKGLYNETYINGTLTKSFTSLEDGLTYTNFTLAPCPTHESVKVVCDTLCNEFLLFLDNFGVVDTLLGNGNELDQIMDASCGNASGILGGLVIDIDPDGPGGNAPIPVPTGFNTWTPDQKIQWILPYFGMSTYDYQPGRTNGGIDASLCVPLGEEQIIWYTANNGLVGVAFSGNGSVVFNLGPKGDLSQKNCNETTNAEENICTQTKFIYSGIENTGTRYNFNYDIEVTNNDGSIYIVSVPVTGNFVAQMIAWESAFTAAYSNDSDVCQIERRWHEWRGITYTGSIPQDIPEWSFDDAVGQYINFVSCATEKTKYPISAKIINSSNKNHIGKDLIVGQGVSPVIFNYECVDCGFELDKCSIPCESDFPEVVEPSCNSITLLEGCDIVLPEDPDAPQDTIKNQIVLISNTCTGETSSNWYEIQSDGELEDYNNGNGLIGFYGDCQTCDNIEVIPTREDCGSYTGRKKNVKKEGRFILVEKQFDETITGVQSVDISTDLGLPPGSVIATIDNQLWTGGAGTIVATSTANDATFSVSGSQPVCIKVQHGGAIPLNGGQDCFSSNDGVPYTFTGNLTDPAATFTQGVSGCVTSSVTNNVGAINWTSDGSATSVTASTTNTNAFNSVRFWVAVCDCVEVVEWISCDGTICKWYNGKEEIDLSIVEECEPLNNITSTAPIDTICSTFKLEKCGFVNGEFCTVIEVTETCNNTTTVDTIKYDGTAITAKDYLKIFDCKKCVQLACPIYTGRGSNLWEIKLADGTIWTPSSTPMPYPTALAEFNAQYGGSFVGTAGLYDVRNLSCTGTTADIGEIQIYGASAQIESITIGVSATSNSEYPFSSYGNCNFSNNGIVATTEVCDQFGNPYEKCKRADGTSTITNLDGTPIDSTKLIATVTFPLFDGCTLASLDGDISGEAVSINGEASYNGGGLDGTIQGVVAAGQGQLATGTITLASWDGTTAVFCYSDDATTIQGTLATGNIGFYIGCDGDNFYPVTDEVLNFSQKNCTPTIGECSDFVVEKFYEIKPFTEGTIKTSWENIDLENSDPNYPANNDDAAICKYIDNFDVSQTPTTAAQILNTGFQVNDIGTAGNSNDYEITTSWIIVSEPVQIRWYGGSEGAIKVSFGLCGGPLTEEFCDARFGAPPSQSIYLPVGIHQYEIINFDHQGTNSSYNSEYTVDGINWITDNTPPMVQFATSQPNEICKTVKICKPSGTARDIKTGNIVDLENCEPCPISCTPNNTTTDVILVSEVKCCYLDETDTCNPTCNTYFRNRFSDGSLSYSDFNGNNTTPIGTPTDCSSCIIEEEPCQILPEINISSNSNTSGLNPTWNYGINQQPCPLEGDVELCGIKKWNDPNTIGMTALDNDITGSWTGTLVLYWYHFVSGATVRTWVRVYEEGNGWVTGWITLSVNNNESTFCMKRTGTTTTYTVDGTVIYTGTTTYTGLLYYWQSLYAHPTNIWSTGTHKYSNLTFCQVGSTPTARTANQTTRLRSIQRRLQELSEDEARKIMQSDGLSKKEIEAVFPPVENISFGNVSNIREGYRWDDYRTKVSTMTEKELLKLNKNRPNKNHPYTLWEICDKLNLSTSGTKKAMAERIYKFFH